VDSSSDTKHVHTKIIRLTKHETTGIQSYNSQQSACSASHSAVYEARSGFGHQIPLLTRGTTNNSRLLIDCLNNQCIVLVSPEP
jgi:hypothetical protein